jgi:hypothetical protein
LIIIASHIPPPLELLFQVGTQLLPGLGLDIAPGVQPASAGNGVPGGAAPVDGPEMGGTAPPEFEPTGPTDEPGDDPDGAIPELEGPTGAITSPVEPPSI